MYFANVVFSGIGQRFVLHALLLGHTVKSKFYAWISSGAHRVLRTVCRTQ